MNVFLAICVVFGVFNVTSAKNYYVQNTKLNWYGASEACSAQGQKLATINSQAEQTDLQNAVQASGKAAELMWLSGSDVVKEGSWVWFSTGKPFTFTHWGTGQPSGGAAENCLHYWNFPAGSYSWGDLACSSQLFFICEDC